MSAEEKKLLRSRMRAVCKAMDPAERERLSQAACHMLRGTEAYQRARCLLAYMAMPHECDPMALVRDAWARGKRVAFPVCGPDFSLRLYIPNSPEAFVKGSYGIAEPDPARAVLIRPEALELAIVPGVAFDAACGRLGQGAGYYDRLLPQTEAVLIGLAFPQQIVETVPRDAWDSPMDMVVTGERVYCRKE